MFRSTLVVAAVLALFFSAPAVSSHQQARPPHYDLWLCVHRHEKSSWSDPNAPYYGGLQMGWWFMQTYGARLLATKGTADHWTPLEQMWVAEIGYRRSGFSTAWFNGQWPPSAGRCGL